MLFCRKFFVSSRRSYKRVTAKTQCILTLLAIYDLKKWKGSAVPETQSLQTSFQDKKLV